MLLLLLLQMLMLMLMVSFSLFLVIITLCSSISLSIFLLSFAPVTPSPITAAAWVVLIVETRSEASVIPAEAVDPAIYCSILPIDKQTNFEKSWEMSKLAKSLSLKHGRGFFDFTIKHFSDYKGILYLYNLIFLTLIYCRYSLNSSEDWHCKYLSRCNPTISGRKTNRKCLGFGGTL